MPRDIIKEAIAEAKSVREMAIANAKAQIEEAFRPHLSSMLSTRLRNEIDSGVNEDNDATSAIGTGLTVDNPGPKKPSSATSSSSHIKNPGLEIDDFDDPATALKGKSLKEADEFGDEDEFGMDDDPAALGQAPPAAPPAPMAPQPPEGAGMDMGGDLGGDMGMGADLGMGGDIGEPDELDLDAIIRELELDIDGISGAGVEEPTFDAPIDDPTVPKMEAFDDPFAGTKIKGPMDGALKEDAEGVHSDGKSPADCEGVPGGKKVNPGQAVTGTAAETMKESEELDLDEILREMEEEDAAVNQSSQLAQENVALKRKLVEHRNAIQILRGRMNEINMLNAKLLYTNKLFKNFDLRVEQKMRVVENFDRASTVREVKLVFATLAESLGGKSAVKKSTKAITESFASKPVSGTAPKSPTILAEGDELRARMQKLAGILKN